MTDAPSSQDDAGVSGVEAHPTHLGGFTARSRPTFGLRPTLRFSPVMIAETGCAPDGRKPGWVTSTMNDARADGVDALVWFEFAKETDWRLSETPATARAARTVLRGPGWRQGGDLAAVEQAVGRVH
jgi:hypothetical protein